MDIRDLELIRAIHDTGSLSRASVDLHMSQPTLSKKLARLEQQLGTTLFHRYPKGLVATDVARYVMEKARPLRAQIGEIERHVELMTQLEQGRINLGVGPIIEQVLLPKILEQFIASTGNVELSIVTEDDETLLSMFDAAELDIIVGPFQIDMLDTDYLVAIPMISDSIIAVARASHPLFAESSIELDALIQYSWAAPKPQGSTRMEIDHPIFNRMKLQSDNYDVLKKITLTSDLICAGPKAVFAEEIAAGQLREISAPLNVSWESALLIKPETYETPLARHLVSLFESAI